MSDVEAARPLAWSRIGIGILLLLLTTPVLIPLHLPFTAGSYPLRGWPFQAWSGSAVWGAGVPATVIALACVVRTLAALCFTFGYRTTQAGLVAGLCGYFLMFREPFGFNATLHLLLQASLLLAMTDAGAALALRPARPRNPHSSKLLIRAFLASIYFWASVVKLRSDWLDGRTLALFHENGALRGALADFLLQTSTSRAVIACGIAATELSLPLLLWAPRTRRWAPFVALSMHAVIELVARPDLLGWAMAALLLSTLPRAGPLDALTQVFDPEGSNRATARAGSAEARPRAR